jgi:N-acetylglutamate synthase-like GNAT family acetyltransferase
MKVFDEYQGNGLGSIMVTALKEVCKHIGAESIWLFSAPETEGFYAKQGFYEISLGMFKNISMPNLLCMEWKGDK